MCRCVACALTKLLTIAMIFYTFQEFVASNVPIMLDYYDASDPSNQLVVTFEKCDFIVSARTGCTSGLNNRCRHGSDNGSSTLLFFLQNNRYFGMGSQNSLIYGNSVQNQVVIMQSLFEDNDMVWNNTRVSIRR